MFAEEGLGPEERRQVAEEAEREKAQEAERRRRSAEVRANNMMHAIHDPPTCSFVGVHPRNHIIEGGTSRRPPNYLAL